MIRPRRKEEGAVIVTVAFALLLLLGFMGIALDFGHLFVVRTELQTSMDACALAAAQEMDGQADSQTRGIAAGITAGNLNNVDMQSTSWSGKTRVSAADITFLDQNYVGPASVANARYVRCRHTQAGTQTRLIHTLSALGGSPAYAGAMDVSASAIATLAPAQSTCPMPLALHPKSGSTGPNYGFAKGDWITLLSKTGATNGQIGWANLDGSNSASETAAELDGRCGTRVGDTLGTPGVQSSVIDNWNGRFGMYRGNKGPSDIQPDFTGVVYTAKTWTTQRNAIGDFLAKRQTFATCNGGTAVTKLNACETWIGYTLNSFKQDLATPGSSGELHNLGGNRRLVVVPVVDGANKVIDFSCMLVLQPIPAPFSQDNDVKLEYVGSASELGSPCTANGMAGGTAGPLVPVLVR